MAKIVVTPEEMQSASTKLAEISSAYTELYTELLQHAGTMGDAWAGEDNLAFVEQINGFCEELKAMADKIATASKALDVQRQNYVGRQESNISQIKKLTN